MLPEPTPPNPAHRPVLRDEVVHWLAPKEGMAIVDGTAGAGGHSAALAGRWARRAADRPRSRPGDAALAERRRGACRSRWSRRPTAISGRSSTARDRCGRRPPARPRPLVRPAPLGLARVQLRDRRPPRHAVRPGSPTRPRPTWSTPCRRRPGPALLSVRRGTPQPPGRPRIVEERRLGPIATTARLAATVRQSIPGKWGPIDPATRIFQRPDRGQ